MLKSEVSVIGKVEVSQVGLMQGGPLLPFLANIHLDELDKELEKRGHQFARYAEEHHSISRETHEIQSQRTKDHCKRTLRAG